MDCNGIWLLKPGLKFLGVCNWVHYCYVQIEVREISQKRVVAKKNGWTFMILSRSIMLVVVIKSLMYYFP
jgi:hypothetical protein